MDKIFTHLSPHEILNHPFYNKGTAFTQEERDELHLHGLLPYRISTLEEQVQRRYQNFLQKKVDLAKYSFLSALQNRNEILFYRLVYEHVDEMLPFIYTPTVGEAAQKFTYTYNHNRGLYLSYPLRDKIEEIINAYPLEDVQVIVVTDGERILGLGDLGVGGMVIPVGKLSLYTLFGGIHPLKTLPILLDVGTNNQALLDDPLYIGWRHHRIVGDNYFNFVDTFVTALKKKYPKVLLQWEDFGREHARPLLANYEDSILSFNDDIQGTASVTLGAILAAVNVSKIPLTQQKIMILGGGSAGLGIADLILHAMCDAGLSEKEALSHLYILDIDGLLHQHLQGLRPEQRKFARDHEEVASWGPSLDLLTCVKNVHPTALIGVSTQKGAFSQKIVEEMAKHIARPIIFPLSNPTSQSEAIPEDLLKWTNGNAIIATGSPFTPVEYGGKKRVFSQCNNVYIFPGVGLGVVAVQAKKVTQTMFQKASEVLAENSPALLDPAASLFPKLKDLRAISKKIAIAVALIAVKEGLCSQYTLEEIETLLEKTMWHPHYMQIKRFR